MNKVAKQQALIDVLKHDPKDKKYKLKDFENFARIEENIFTQKSVRLLPDSKQKNCWKKLNEI